MALPLRTFLLLLLAVVAAVLLYKGSTQQDPKRRSVGVQIGGTAILPLKLNTTLDVEGVKVEWCHDKEYVHVFENGKSYLEYQNKTLINRAFLFEDQISEGNVSLKLINVTEQDAGNYKCSVVHGMPPKKQEFEFYLFLTDTVDDSPHKDPPGSPKPDPTPTPQPNQDWTGTIVSVVVGVAVVGFIAGVLLYICRGNRNNQNNAREMHDLNDQNVDNTDNKDGQDSREDQNNPNNQDSYNNPDDQDSQEDHNN
ncbi:uncharacterized protein LOC121504879 [Cheilinus undulatus]|uniref:uncharacterized protein LOC121504879 n=1 Tax=Cheilinus undulatus TaxID=241271 RepID=UPI001BD6ABAF|nr:uncharacterized protein LOC121504879 [Cheilinus undulatus]